MQFRYHLYILLFILLLMLLLLVIVFFLLMLIILFILFILLLLIILLLILLLMLLLLLYELLPIVCDNSHRCSGNLKYCTIVRILSNVRTHVNNQIRIYIYNIYILSSKVRTHTHVYRVTVLACLTWSCCDPQSFDVVSQGFQLISWLASLISCSISLIR